MRVFSKLYKITNDLPVLKPEDQIFYCVKQLMNGSVLERYRKHPNNAQIVREMKIRLESLHKLIVGVELYVESFKERYSKSQDLQKLSNQQAFLYQDIGIFG